MEKPCISVELISKPDMPQGMFTYYLIAAPPTNTLKIGGFSGTIAIIYLCLSLETTSDSQDLWKSRINNSTEITGGWRNNSTRKRFHRASCQSAVNPLVSISQVSLTLMRSSLSSRKRKICYVSEGYTRYHVCCWVSCFPYLSFVGSWWSLKRRVLWGRREHCKVEVGQLPSIITKGLYISLHSSRILELSRS